MQNKKHTEDLDYLAELGFESVPVDKREIRQLERKVKHRFFKRAGFLPVAVVSLVVGAVIGGLVFYNISPLEKSVAVEKSGGIASQPYERTATVYLDTIVVMSENFVNPAPVRKSPQVSLHQELPETNSDTLNVVILDPVVIPTIADKPLTEQKLKFIINSPLVYIHDLKVSDYRTLYFRKNQFVKFEDDHVSAEYSSATAATPGLKQEAGYFLHEELAAALKQFRKGDYDAASVKLLEVASYNKSDINCDFYLGMCYYHKKYYAKAVERLDACTGNPNNAFLQEAMYYKALALLEQGKKNEAQEILKKIVEEDEFYAEKAKLVLGSL